MLNIKYIIIDFNFINFMSEYRNNSQNLQRTSQWRALSEARYKHKVSRSRSPKINNLNQKREEHKKNKQNPALNSEIKQCIDITELEKAWAEIKKKSSEFDIICSQTLPARNLRSLSLCENTGNNEFYLRRTTNCEEIIKTFNNNANLRNRRSVSQTRNRRSLGHFQAITQDMRTSLGENNVSAQLMQNAIELHKSLCEFSSVDGASKAKSKRPRSQSSHGKYNRNSDFCMKSLETKQNTRYSNCEPNNIEIALTNIKQTSDKNHQPKQSAEKKPIKSVLKKSRKSPEKSKELNKNEKWSSIFSKQMHNRSFAENTRNNIKTGENNTKNNNSNKPILKDYSKYMVKPKENKKKIVEELQIDIEKVTLNNENKRLFQHRHSDIYSSPAKPKSPKKSKIEIKKAEIIIKPKQNAHKNDEKPVKTHSRKIDENPFKLANLAKPIISKEIHKIDQPAILSQNEPEKILSHNEPQSENTKKQEVNEINEKPIKSEQSKKQNYEFSKAEPRRSKTPSRTQKTVVASTGKSITELIQMQRKIYSKKIYDLYSKMKKLTIV